MENDSTHSLTDEDRLDTTLLRRDTYDHDKFDIDLLQDIKGMNVMKAPWKFKLETVIATWILFNAISTLMIIMENFRRSVPAPLRAEFGQTNFDILTYVIMYFPVSFFMLLWLLYNNAFSEMTFYMYIRRGAIIDYPGSTDWRFLLCHVRPMLFLILFIGYAGGAIYTLLYFKAGVGTIAIFANNLFIGVGLFWFRQQGIEWKFVSISDFIQAFPDRNNSHGNMDEVSLAKAAKLMRDFTLTESSHASYSGYMRNFYWQNQNYNNCWKILHHLLYWGVIVALAGLSFGYFFIIGRLDVKSRWEGELNPCLAVCTELAQNLSVVNTKQCQRCACACMFQTRNTDEAFVEACHEYAVAPVCDKIAKRCPTFSECGFNNPWSRFDL